MDSAILEILKNIPALSNVDEDELGNIAKKAKIQNYPKDSYIFHENDKGNLFYVIKSGKIDILRKNSEGEEASVAVLYPDNFFGEMALINDAPRNASAKCLEDCEMYIFDKNDFYDLLYL